MMVMGAHNAHAQTCWPHTPAAQVRLKLLPLLLEWDVRQGPTPSPSSCVQLRPVSIRSISKRGGGAGGGGAAEQAPWRYILQVERLAGSNTARAGSSSSSGGAAATAAQAEEDAAIDEAWLSGTARSRPQPPPSSQTGTPLQSPLKELDRLLGRAPSGADAGEEDGEVGCSQPGGSQAAPLGSQAAGRKAVGTLSFGEHRSLRCSLLEGLWPALVQEFGERQAGGRGRGKGRAASGSGARARATKAGQASVLNYFSPRKVGCLLRQGEFRHVLPCAPAAAAAVCLCSKAVASFPSSVPPAKPCAAGLPSHLGGRRAVCVACTAGSGPRHVRFVQCHCRRKQRSARSSQHAQPHQRRRSRCCRCTGRRHPLQQAPFSGAATTLPAWVCAALGAARV